MVLLKLRVKLMKGLDLLLHFLNTENSNELHMVTYQNKGCKLSSLQPLLRLFIKFYWILAQQSFLNRLNVFRLFSVLYLGLRFDNHEMLYF